MELSSGFFEFFEVPKELSIKKRRKFVSIELTCSDCGLLNKCISPKIEPMGKGKKKVMLIGESPGWTEDEQNTFFVGETGQYLRKMLFSIGIDLVEDCITINAIKCRPSNNKITMLNINACRKYVFEAIDKYKPEVIILVGESALLSVLGHRLQGRISKVKFGDWVGSQIPDQEMKIWLCPVYHPSFVKRQEWDEILYKNWKQSFESAFSLVNKSFYIHNYESDVFFTKDVEEAKKWIIEAKNKGGIYAYDYETTGIKPHREGHKILTASFSDGLMGYAFPFFNNSEFIGLWKNFLSSSNCKFISHKLTFEQMWNNKYNMQYSDWFWDSELAVHCLDNRVKRTQLKFWVYRYFGILGYDVDIDDYLETTIKGENKKSKNSFNSLEYAPLDKLLLYNGLDSLFTKKIYDIQDNLLTHKMRECFLFLLNGSKWLLRAQENGFRIDEDKMHESELLCDKRMGLAEKRILSDPILKNKWNEKKLFNIRSDKDLRLLLTKYYNIKIDKKTVNNNESVDKDSLSKIDLPITKNILEYRRWYKAKNTNIAQFKREIVKGYIHPFYHLSTVKTARSSSSDPNLQNQYKQDKVMKKVVRSLIIPRNGNRLIEWDYKIAEVCSAACYTKDPYLIQYIEDESKDMHRDNAMDILFKVKSEITKEERYITKNGFTFPEFYGAWYIDIAQDLWSRWSEETMKHLFRMGIKNYRDFEEHIKKIDYKFWVNKFHVFAEWKEKIIIEYKKRGFVDLYTGFRCYGHMKKNEILNRQFQGTAFHWLLWTLSQVMEKIDNNKRSFIMGETHDSMQGDIHPDDEEEIDSLVYEYGTQKIREHWPWIIVPLRIEKERSQIDGNWAEMEECGYLKNR